MSTSRREFLRTAAATGAVAALSPLGLARAAGRRQPGEAERKMKILMMGGTGFLGPIIVQHAIDRGHEVTLFHRSPERDLFPELEHLYGDRYQEGALEPLKGRSWDVAIDTWTYLPYIVRRSAEALRDSVQNYQMVSTISVYGDRNEVDMTEDAELATMPEEVVDTVRTNRDIGQHYGAFKALCEQTIEEVMGGRSCNVRPGLIVGPRDRSHRWNWWPHRIRKGGEVIGPGGPEQYTQIIDVRDCGEFCVTAAEKLLTGSYNAVTPARALTMGKTLETCKRVSGSDASFTWIPEDFLEEQGVQPWAHMPAWIPPSAPGYEGFGQLSTEKSERAGLKFRTLEDTVQATLDWLDTLTPEQLAPLDKGFGVEGGGGGGMPPEFEARVLAAWKARNG
jgi:2'-hydroxyisoflavone reductase